MNDERLITELNVDLLRLKLKIIKTEQRLLRRQLREDAKKRRELERELFELLPQPDLFTFPNNRGNQND